MLACIPTNGNTGLEDTVSDHFGSAPYFTLFDSEDGKITVVENRNAHHDHGTCHPMNQLVRYHIDCVVCSGMGRRAIEALNSEGIKIYHSDSRVVGEVVDKIKANNLTEIDPRKACRGHGQTAGVGHGPQASKDLRSNQGRGSGYGRGRCQRRGPGDGGRGRGN